MCARVCAYGLSCTCLRAFCNTYPCPLLTPLCIQAREVHESTLQKMDLLKKKLEKEKERVEVEMEESKTRHEAELDDLRRKVGWHTLCVDIAPFSLVE